MRVVFATYDFRAETLPLQPWLTIGRVAAGLHRCGHEVHIVTDVARAAEVPGVEAHSVASLRGTNDHELTTKITALSPDVLVALPTPLNLVTSPWMLRNGVRRVGFASYPFYTAGELWRGVRSLGWRATRPYLRHALVPRTLWAGRCMRAFDAVITQSESTHSRMQHAYPQLKAAFIPPGIELHHWPLGGPAPDGIELLYLGAALPIRGFDVLLRAMVRLRGTPTRLKVMARGADVAETARIREQIARYGLADKVTVWGGWSERSTLVREIHRATVVVLPFVLVPSELPVTVMEVIACGTPVIGTRIDGLPSTIGPAGTTVAQGSDSELASVVRRLHHDPDLIAEWRAGCVMQRNRMVAWDAVTGQWEQVLRG